jgi:hypothetical protein
MDTIAGASYQSQVLLGVNKLKLVEATDHKVAGSLSNKLRGEFTYHIKVDGNEL